MLELFRVTTKQDSTELKLFTSGKKTKLTDTFAANEFFTKKKQQKTEKFKHLRK